MLNSPLGGRRGIGFGLGRSWQRKAAGEDWWLAGGIPAANCIAAYQPKGAANYEASKVNLTGNAAYNAYEGKAPNWNVTNGWMGDAINGLYLKTGIIIPNQDVSVVVRVSNKLNVRQAIMGSIAGSGKAFGFFDFESNGTQFRNGNGFLITKVFNAGVLGIAGLRCYFDGVYEATISDSGNYSNIENYILAHNYIGAAADYCDVYIQALAIYNMILTDPQMLAVTTAMNVL